MSSTEEDEELAKLPKLEKVMLAYGYGIEASREAVTEYLGLGPTISGCSWLELRPLTKHRHELLRKLDDSDRPKGVYIIGGTKGADLNMLEVDMVVKTLWVIFMIRFKLKSRYMEDKYNFAVYYVVVPCTELAFLIHHIIDIL